MEELSNEVKEEIKRLLPGLREQVISEFAKLGITPTKPFYSDKACIESLPYAAYEYIILCWEVAPERIDKEALLSAINNKLFTSMHKIVAHGLRKMGKVNHEVIAKRQ